MEENLGDGFHGAMSDWAARVAAPGPDFQIAFNNGNCLIEFWAPRDADTQEPHDRDEVYVIIAGSADFRMSAERRGVKAGDVIFVPTGMPHRFETFSNDLAMWIVFFGERHGSHDRSPE